MDPGPDVVNESGLASSKRSWFMDHPFHTLCWLSSPPDPGSCQRGCCSGLLSSSTFWALGFFFCDGNAGSTFPSKADIPGLYIVVLGPSLWSETPPPGGLCQQGEALKLREERGSWWQQRCQEGNRHCRRKARVGQGAGRSCRLLA